MSSRRTFTSEYMRECAELVIKHSYQVKEAYFIYCVPHTSLLIFCYINVVKHF